jgi:hypothetical protein
MKSLLINYLENDDLELLHPLSASVWIPHSSLTLRRGAVDGYRGCCAFAGDRGFLFPELTESATEAEASQIPPATVRCIFSSSRTCEIGMTRATGQVYRSCLHLLEYASRLRWTNPEPQPSGGNRSGEKNLDAIFLEHLLKLRV